MVNWLWSSLINAGKAFGSQCTGLQITSNVFIFIYMVIYHLLFIIFYYLFIFAMVYFKYLQRVYRVFNCYIFYVRI